MKWKVVLSSMLQASFSALQGASVFNWAVDFASLAWQHVHSFPLKTTPTTTHFDPQELYGVPIFRCPYLPRLVRLVPKKGKHGTLVYYCAAGA